MERKELARKTKILVHFAAQTLKFLALLLPARLKYGGKHIFLVSERGNDARDNGYHFFKYVRTAHPEQPAYYAIDKTSADYDKVAPYGNVVARGSLTHYLLFLADTVKISTHHSGAAPESNYYFNLGKVVRLPGKQVFLQHGVIKDDLPVCHRENSRFDLFICGAKPEYDYVLENFHYTDQVVKYTGLARYDNLQQFEVKKQILVMPTWRKYLQQRSAEEMARTEYVRRWDSFLNAPSLLHALRERGVQLVFYPHYEVQKHLHLFHSPGPEVVLADFDHYDVQQLLKESALLVTDYSSVFFDFAYMKKPCFYYFFDREEFCAGHYAQGYFDYDTMGFGEVARDEAALLEGVVACMERNFRIEERYLKRIEGFFPLHDGENCKRIYDCVEAMLSKQ
ncbi:MAG: CDP-glycerol glycerophosphotransferase family protein [Oscillospiraceae bacterium]|nr:CDP-glycerol glycerophosphotransferase family protein [Oscillospiraceae bacterium]